MVNIADELRKFGDLREGGLLSEEEFVAAKAALLRSFHAAAPPEMRACGDCEASGKCQKCGGDGYWYDRGFRFAAATQEPCGTCHRSGKCPTCKGTGKVVVER